MPTAPSAEWSAKRSAARPALCRAGLGPFLAIVLPAVAIGAASALAPMSRATRFSLGVVRADGVLLPFAHFDDGKWKNEWPVPPKRVDVPITLDAVPKDWWPDDTPELEWTLWTFDGNARRIEVTQPFLTPLYCGAVVGLRTTFTPEGLPPALSEQPYPKVGLATTGDVVIEPVTVVEEGTDDWRRIEARLREPFTRAEGAAIAREWGAFGWGFPVPDERANQPIKLEALYRAPHETPGALAYFIEASRRYERPRGSEEPCDLVTFVWGWALAEPHGELGLKPDVFITNCHRSGVSVLFPLALIRLGDQVLWVGQWSGWEEELYAVVEVPRDLEVKTLTRTLVGSCW